MPNKYLLQEIILSYSAEIEPSPFLECDPAPIEAKISFSKIRGMMLGLTVGDALGNTTESMLPGERSDMIGEIRDYLHNPHAGGDRAGLPTDDTQMAFWTLEQALEDGGLIPERLAEKFARRQIFGIGSSVKKWRKAYLSGLPWHKCSPGMAGNGALMRIAPVLIPHLAKPSPALWADGLLAGMLTHNDRASNSACVAFLGIFWELLQINTAPSPEWWVDRYVEIAGELEGDTRYRPRGGEFHEYEGPMWKYVNEKVRHAWEKNMDALSACNSWWSGAYLMETVPSVLYILMRHGHDPEEAIVRAVNDTKDNDTVAAIVGAAVGALHGEKGLPQGWIKGLLGRTGNEDDGRVFDLLDQAELRFWPPPEKEQ